jgi:L-asparaginase
MSFDVPETSPRPKVCVLHVGGTIGMVRSAAGTYEPRPGFLADFLARMPELEGPEVPAHDVVQLEPLIDSADTRPRDWVRIARAIVARHAEYTGFVVVHGTDTMAYTASALSFLLPGLAQPVVMTGSQLSLAHSRSDGREHVVTSLILAGFHEIPEVSLYFGSRLLRGNRAQKVHNQDFVAFDSGNLPPLASVGARIQVNRHLVRAKGAGLASDVRLVREPAVAAIRLFPGLDARLLAKLLEPPIEAVVLETYGAGNAPSRDAEFLDAIEAAVSERDVVVVSCSQCHGGAVRPDVYSTGARLARAGVISGHDMTPEAALTKLYCLLGAGRTPAQVRDAVGTDLAGELEVER